MIGQTSEVVQASADVSEADDPPRPRAPPRRLARWPARSGCRRHPRSRRRGRAQALAAGSTRSQRGARLRRSRLQLAARAGHETDRRAPSEVSMSTLTLASVSRRSSPGGASPSLDRSQEDEPRAPNASASHCGVRADAMMIPRLRTIPKRPAVGHLMPYPRRRSQRC